MSNIEEDIKLLKKFNPGDEYTEKIKGAIKNVLAEREVDKKRIKELEAVNKMQEYRINEMDIPKQKVKDVLQRNRNELFSITYVEPIQYEPFEMQIDRINKIERELLEDK